MSAADGPGRSTWTSGLYLCEIACLRAAGFEPVGQVMGAAVYAMDPRLMTRFRFGARLAYGSSPLNAFAAHRVLHAAREEAMATMTAQCRALGGDGIIAAHVEIGPFHGDKRTLLFQVSGTAVRARGSVRPPRPFSSDLSAQEFGKLIAAGWVPVELVVGAAIGGLYDTFGVRRQTRRFARNQEVRQWNQTVGFIRRRAADIVRRDAAASGADGVVVSRCDLELYEFGEERFVEARFVGTAIAMFRAGRPRVSPLGRLVYGRRLARIPPASTSPSIMRLDAPEG